MPIVNEVANAAEFTVEKKVEGAYFWKRVGLWAAYIGGPLILLVISGMTGLIAAWLIIFVPVYFPFLLPKIIYPATYRYVQIEYEYTITSGNLTVNYLYGRKTRKNWLPPTNISRMEMIAPYRGEYKAAADAADIVNRYDAVAYRDQPDNYFAIFYNEQGEKCVVMFQAITKLLKLIEFHNKNAVIVEVSA